MLNTETTLWAILGRNHKDEKCFSSGETSPWTANSGAANRDRWRIWNIFSLLKGPFLGGAFSFCLLWREKNFFGRGNFAISLLRCHDLERIQATPADPVDHCLAGGRTRVPSGELPDFEVVLILCKGGSGARRASWPRGAFVAGRSRRGRKGEKLVSSSLDRLPLVFSYSTWNTGKSGKSSRTAASASSGRRGARTTNNARRIFRTTTTGQTEPLCLRRGRLRNHLRAADLLLKLKFQRLQVGDNHWKIYIFCFTGSQILCPKIQIYDIWFLWSNISSVDSICKIVLSNIKEGLLQVFLSIDPGVNSWVRCEYQALNRY